MAASSVALGCRRLFLNAEEDSSKLKPLRKSQMLRFACANLPMKSGSLSATRTSRVSIYSAAAAAAAEDPSHYNNQQASKIMGKETRSNDKEPVCANEVDEWMRDSVTEIVRNIGEAPFLVNVYSNEGDDDDGSSATKTRTRLETEPAVSEDWPRISRRWKENSTSKPDGVILVEQLKDHEEDGSLMECSQCSRSWGIVIQGRGLDRAACYILKTSRVCSSVGFCTHFCLVRAKCFGEAAELQLRDSWLQRQ